MASNTIELILKFTGDKRQLDQTVAAVRADLSKSVQGQVAIAKDVNRQVASEAKNQTRTLEREERERLRAAQSLQRQRSSALIAAWKAELREKEKIEKEKADAEKGATSGLTGVVNQIPILRNFTSQFSSLTTEAGAASGAIVGVAGAIGIIVAGAAIGIAALAKLGEQVFELAKKTAEFEGKFFDLSQQVGVSVETLSALDIIASTTGGDIETVSASLAIFQKHLEASHDPTSKEAKLLKELNVTSLETETAFRQALKGLFAFGEGSKQTDAALQLFGRSGRFVNAILKDSKGNLDAAAKGFGNLVVARDAAAAADAFNDSLEILNRTAARFAANLISQTIPVFTEFFRDVNKGLTGNAEDWSFWADVIRVEVAGVLGTLEGLALFIRTGGFIDLSIAIDTSIRSLLERAEKERNKLSLESAVETAKRLALATSAGKPGDRPDADKANTEASARANKALQNQQQALEEHTREHRVAMERERDLDLKSINEWEDESKAAIKEHLSGQLALFDQEEQNVNKFVKNREDALLALAAIENKRIKATNETREAIQKIEDEANTRRNQAELNLNQQLLRIRDAQRDAEQQQIKSDLDRGVIAESGALQRQLALLKQAFDDRNVLRGLEIDQSTISADRLIQINNERIEAEINYTKEFKRLTEERIAAMLREGAAATPAPGGVRPVLTPAGTVNVGLPPPETLEAQINAALRAQGAFAGLGVAISDTFNLGASGAQAFGDVLTSTFSQLAQAVGEAVHAFVLFGSVQGGFRRFAAEVIASIAQMAVVQAIWEAGQGLAMLALTYFTGNPKYAQSAGAHFAAAAVYGGIAAVAIPAGRAVAGNSFNQSGGGGGAGGSGDQNGTGQLNPLTLGRNQSNPPRIIVQLPAIHVNPNDRFGQAVTAEWAENYRRGGITREVTMEDGGAR